MSNELPRWLRRSFRSSFVKSAGMLAAGSAVSQIVLIASLPLLTRIYTPADFGLLGVYAAILGVVSTVSCLGYDNAIPIPEADEEAINILALALLLTVCTGILMAAVAVGWSNELGKLLHQPSLVPYAWLIPVGALLSGSYSALQFWAVRQRSFATLARWRVFQAGSGVAVQISLGTIGLSPLGLLLGQPVNSGAGVVGLGSTLLRGKRLIVEYVSFRRIKEVFSRYGRFAKYTTPDLLANSAGIQLPIVLISAMEGGLEVGFLFLSMRVMQAPMALVGNAISQVYYAQASEAFRAGTLRPLTEEVLTNLARIGVGPLVFAAIIAPQAFVLLFGSEWRRSGQLVAWMTPWLVVQFLTSPVSMSLYATGRQSASMLLQFAGLGIRVIPVVIAIKVAPTMLSEVYALTGFGFYALYLLVVTKVVGINRWGMSRILASSLYIVTFSLVSGVALSWLIWVLTGV